MKTPEHERPFLEPIGSYAPLPGYSSASGPAKKRVFGERVPVTIKLHNQKDRILKPDDPTQTLVERRIAHRRD